MADPTRTNVATGTSNTATTAASFGFTATAGRLLVLVVGADDYTTGTPSGYTLSSGCNRLSWLGHYLYWKIAAGTETTVSYTIGSATHSAWAVLEFDNIDSFDVSGGQDSSGTSLATYSTGNVTPTTGRRFAIASIGGGETTDFTGIGSWTNSYTEQAESATTGTGTRDIISVATLALDGDSSTTTSTTATYTPNASAHTGIIAVFKVAGATPTREQKGFRFRNDDGSETAATWIASQNTNPGEEIIYSIGAFGEFETSTDGTVITDTILDSCWTGLYSTSWFTVSNPSAQTPGALSYTTIETDAARTNTKYFNINGGGSVAPGTSTRGMRVVHSADEAIQLSGFTGANVGIGCHFRWNGANQNYSPRDIIALRSDPTGNYQFLQGTDDPTSPNLHAHWQPGGTGVGSPVVISKDHWYWIRMQHVDGGQTFTVEVYDAEAGYSLVGTSTGSVSGSYTGGATTIQIGCVYYSAGSGQSFDFDNIELTFDGTLPSVPTI